MAIHGGSAKTLLPSRARNNVAPWWLGHVCRHRDAWRDTAFGVHEVHSPMLYMFMYAKEQPFQAELPERSVAH